MINDVLDNENDVKNIILQGEGWHQETITGAAPLVLAWGEHKTRDL
jgi:hypothetical protein